MHDMQKLNVLGSVMYIAAHPDDENTRLLSWLANERKYRTVYLSLTRGDGGQNLIGSEKGELLGMLRTEELLAARRIDGAEQWFTGAVDFGYSKSPEETFNFWNREKVLAEVVFAIRKFRPDVIITRFPATGEGGHGHHTASAILAAEAFEKAGDAKAFPEQLAYVSVWQPRRLFWNTFNFGGNNTTSPDQLKLDVGGFNPLLGKSYGEIAALSRSCHKSQGFGSAMQRGTQLEYFLQLKGDSAINDPFEGIQTGWNRLGRYEHITKAVQKCLDGIKPADPAAAIPELKKIYLMLNAVQEKDANVRYWKELKRKELQKVILDCAGIWAESGSSDHILTENAKNVYTTRLIVRNQVPVKLLRIFNSHLSEIDTSFNMKLATNDIYQYKKPAELSNIPGFSMPYWLNPDRGSSEFAGASDRYGMPVNRIIPVTFVQLEVAGLQLQLELPVVHPYTDPVKGGLTRPVEILPALTVIPSCRVLVMNGSNKRKISFLVRANAGGQKGRLVLQGLAGCKINMPDSLFDLSAKGDEKTFEAEVESCDSFYSGVLKASVLTEGRKGRVWDLGIERLEYDHIPPRFNLFHCEVSVVNIQSATAGRKIAYIRGAGDDIPGCLKQIGFEVTELSDELLRTADLSVYDAVVCGVRAYNTNPVLFAQHDRLMEYVRNGGRLLVQYNTNSRVGPVQGNIGPYPFSITRKRVTDENAKVLIADQISPVLNYPNKIDSADFSGWVQERGVYFADVPDSSYRKVLGMKDPGEEMQYGSLIWTQYGKGVFIYTGLSFFRQLPAGVPGAYRLFVNLLSVPVKE